MKFGASSSEDMQRRRLIDVEHETGGIHTTKEKVVESGEKVKLSWPAVSWSSTGRATARLGGQWEGLRWRVRDSSGLE
jgi:hypothetical protein